MPADASPAAREPATRPLLPLWAALIVAVVGGLALDASFPALGIWPLAYVAIALSLVSIIGRGIPGALLVGFAFGAAFYLPHVSWAARYLGAIPWLALSMTESILLAAGTIPIALAYRWVGRPGAGWIRRALLLPMLVSGLWTAREVFLGSWPYGGFAWGRIGMSQAESPTSALASWVGVSGVTFLMVALCALAIEWVRIRGWRQARTAIPIAGLAVILVATPQWRTAASGNLTVGSVQGNGPAGYFDVREPLDVLNAQLEATSQLEGESVDVLLWPEGSVDADPLQSRAAAYSLERVSRSFDAPVVANAAITRGEDIYNTSFVWQHDEDNPVQTHAKRHPVPFGEYVPDRWFYESIVPDLIGLLQREYTAGTDEPVFDIDGTRVGLAICFDVIADDVIREGALGGAEAYFFQTNNADFRDTDENLQQLAFARMRAIETGRSVVNLSTVGTSQVIAPDGETIESLGTDRAGTMLTEVELREGVTPGVLFGGVITFVLFWGSLTVLVVSGIGRRWRRRR